MSFKHCLRVILLALVSVAASAQQANDLERKVRSTDLTQLAAEMADGRLAWPRIDWATPATAARSPGYTLARSLLDKIQASEWDDSAFNGGKQATIIKTYAQLSLSLRQSGGYANLLLADTLNRLALVHLCRWAMDDAAHVDDAARTLRDLKLPALTSALSTELARDYAMASGRRLPTTSPAAWPTEASRMPAEARRLRTTRELLEQPDLRSLVLRLTETDREAALNMPLLLLVKKDPVLRQQPRAPYFARDVWQQFQKAFGFPPMSDPDFAAALDKQLGGLLSWSDIDRLQENLRAPGIGGNGAADAFYAVCVGVPPRHSTDAPLKLLVRRTPLAAAPPGPGAIWSSSSGRTYAFLVRDVAALPRAATRPAYAAPGTGGPVRVVVNGKPGPAHRAVAFMREPDGRMTPFRFSATGEHVAYIAQDDGGMRVFVDGRPGPLFEYIEPNTLTICENGATVVYMATRNRRQFVAVNNRVFGPYQYAHDPAVSGNGSAAGWFVGEGNSAVVVINGQARQAVAATPPLVFSQDGRRWAYRAKEAGGTVTRVEGLSPARLLTGSAPVGFSREGRHLLSDGRLESPGPVFSSSEVVVDGRVIAELAEPMHTRPQFTSDGNAVFCKSEKRSFLITPEGAILRETPSSALMNPAGKRLVPWHSSHGPGRRMGIDPGELELAPGKRTRELGGILAYAFGPDERLYYVTMEIAPGLATTRFFFSVEDKDERVTQVLTNTLGFNDDGSFYALGTKRGIAWRITVNGQDSEETVEAILPVKAVFTARNAFRMLGVEAGRLVQLDVTIQGTPAKHEPVVLSAPAAGLGAPRHTQWKRTVVVPDTAAGTGALPNVIKTIVRNGQPVLFYVQVDRTMQAERAPNGDWTTREAFPAQMEDSLRVDVAVVNGTVYVATSGPDGLYIRAMRNGVWKQVHSRPCKSPPVAIGSLDGRATVFTADGNLLVTLTENADGAWTEQRTRMPDRVTPAQFSFRSINGVPTLLIRNSGHAGAALGRLRDGHWELEVIAKAGGPVCLLDLGGKAAVFGWQLLTQQNGDWRAGEPGEPDYRVRQAAFASIQGHPAMVYSRLDSSSVFYRTMGPDGRWSEQIVDAGAISAGIVASLIEVRGKPAIAYTGTSGSRHPLIYIEPNEGE